MFTKLPNSLQIVLQIGGALLALFCLAQTEEIAKDGQRYFEKVHPTVEQVRSRAQGSLESGFTITIHQDQYLDLREATLWQPSTTPDVTTLWAGFIMGVLMVMNTSPNYPKLEKKIRGPSTYPND